MKLNKKNKILLLGFMVALYLCYTFSISKTIFYYKEYQAKKELLATVDISADLFHQLKQKEKKIDQLLSKYNVSYDDSFQNNLLKRLSIYATSNNVKIIDFKEPHLTTKNNILTSSYQFSLQGSFKCLISIINKIENNPNLGQVKHLNFIKKRNFKTNTDDLFLDIILQKTKEIK
jgi:hypothetical protein